ncbi:MAG: hypothetical protein E3J71_07010 [Candidatus Stahlbacteria bacterium]|nr:MAG: hypothetical protein E3J71_07010 [Candidatus Stahlbacteria bacterium]
MIGVKNQKEFKKEVLGTEVPVVVDFRASWCQPCKIPGPIFLPIIGAAATSCPCAGWLKRSSIYGFGIAKSTLI